MSPHRLLLQRVARLRSTLPPKTLEAACLRRQLHELDALNTRNVDTAVTFFYGWCFTAGLLVFK